MKVCVPPYKEYFDLRRLHVTLFSFGAHAELQKVTFTVVHFPQLLSYSNVAFPDSHVII